MKQVSTAHGVLMTSSTNIVVFHIVWPVNTEVVCNSETGVLTYQTTRVSQPRKLHRKLNTGVCTTSHAIGTHNE